MKTLILFAHTFWENSKVNKALLESLKDSNHIKIHNLTTTYPDGKIDAEAEKALLKEADTIIFQFPLFLFSQQHLKRKVPHQKSGNAPPVPMWQNSHLHLPRSRQNI